MIGIGLSGFLLAGVALWLSSIGMAERAELAARVLAGAVQPDLVFETGVAETAGTPHHVVVRRAGPDTSVILSGLPAYHTLTFDLPVDARVVSGHLQLDATSQVLDGVQGALRVTIRGKRRAEALLHPGAQERSLRIPLSAMDVAGDRLVVSVSLQGSAPQHPCSRDTQVAAVVEIETTSAVYAQLDQPIASARDHVRVAGGLVPVAWRHGSRAEALAVATDVSRAGFAPVFGSDGDALPLPELREMVSHPSDPVSTAWPIALAETGANAGLRRFHRDTTWRQRYTTGAGSDRRVAGALDLDLALGGLGPNAFWQLAVTVNDRLVYQARIDAASSSFAARIPLPADVQTRQNVVEITLGTSETRDGPCNDGPLLLAELRAKTQLRPGTEVLTNAMTDMQDALLQAGPVFLSVLGDVPAADAERALALLVRSLPDGVSVAPAVSHAHVLVLSGSAPDLDLPKDARVWAVRHGDAAPEPSIERADTATDVDWGGVVLLVVPAGLSLAEGAT